MRGRMKSLRHWLLWHAPWIPFFRLLAWPSHVISQAQFNSIFPPDDLSATFEQCPGRTSLEDEVA